MLALNTSAARLLVHRWPSKIISNILLNPSDCVRRSNLLRASAVMSDGQVQPRANAVLQYWFGDDYATWNRAEMESSFQAKWFSGSPEKDAEIKELFGEDVAAAGRGDLDGWLQGTWSALAGIILMDQFTRNIFRGTADMYSMDTKAREWADAVLAAGLEKPLHPAQKLFVVLPFMHHEDLASQQRCVDVLKADAAALEAEFGADAASVRMMKQTVDYADAHLEIVQQWGRFPHRNEILGRKSTEAEVKGLADGSIKAF